MSRFLLRRILLGLLTLLLVSIVVFAATQALPGNAARAILGRNATPARLALDNVIRSPGRTGLVTITLAAGIALFVQTSGFIASNGVVIRFDFPFSTSTQVYDMTPSGDTLLGQYTDAANKSHGFLLRLGDAIATFGLDAQQGLAGPFKFVTIDYPGANGTYANGINSRGDVVGAYVDTAGKTHGFFVNLRQRRRDEGQQ